MSAGGTREVGTSGAHDGLAQLAINTVRTLAMDAVQQANSGHPGTPMAMAPVIYAIWQDSLVFDPDDPMWPNRDRFVLSIGHASMLLYAMLHLTGVKAVAGEHDETDRLAVSLDDIRKFRQLDSRAPGHPEYPWTTGVETTTGPLGQGAANSVGMAIASRWLAARYNRPGFDIFDFNVYALAGDGDMMEGVSSEAASLAGHLALSNLCWVYDSNRITIEGPTDLAFSEDVAARFRAYGWHVVAVADANDLPQLRRALDEFKTTSSQPTLVIVDSHIAYGSPHKQDSAAAHGAPLGEAEVRLTKRGYQWPEDAKFLVPEGVREHFAAGIAARGRARRTEWLALFAGYRRAHPDLGEELQLMQEGRLPDDWDADVPEFPVDPLGAATRVSSGQVLNAIAPRVPWLVGGAADLAPSTKTHLAVAAAGDLDRDTPGGRNFHFGVREHAMGAILNGLALCGLRPFGATFLVFSDYARPAMRLAAMMELPVIIVFTHDSISLGEDGPTHQPVEHLASLRAMPGLITLRPADANEVAVAWRTIMTIRHGPVALVLSRQNLPTLDRSRLGPADGLARGAYVLADPADPADGSPELILLASGSEVALCLAAAAVLGDEGIRTRVVSMPSWELFEDQDQAYRDEVLPPEVWARVAVEEGATQGWDRYVGPRGTCIGMTTFGASAPREALAERFGFTVEHVVATAKGVVAP